MLANRRLVNRRLVWTVTAAAVMGLMLMPELAHAQAMNSAPPPQIGNRVDHKERQPTTAEICASGAAVETLDCSPQGSSEIKAIDPQLAKPGQAKAGPGSATTTPPPTGTR
jgi:hypothetical protein